MKNNIYSVIAMASMFLVVQLIALAIAPLYSATQTEAMGGRETITNPVFALVYLGIILAFTGVILWIAKKKKEKFIKILILFAIFMTMTYLFVPLTISIIYPSEGSGWEYNEIGYDVVVLSTGDIDDDGVVEILAGCSDNRLRIYESENHTLEWESEDLGSQIRQIDIAHLDNDSYGEIVVLSDIITVYDGLTKSIEWMNNTADITSITVLYLNNSISVPDVIVAGTANGIVFFPNASPPNMQIDLSAKLDNISYLQAFYDEVTENISVIAANSSTILVVNARSIDLNIELEIKELEDIMALAVYHNPDGEDYLIVGVKTEIKEGEYKGRAYLYNLSSAKHVKEGPVLKNIRAIYFQNYSLPGFDNDEPDVLILGDKTLYIFPDLMEKRKEYNIFTSSYDEKYILYSLTFRYDINTVLSTDLDDDGYMEFIIGKEDGYKHTTVVFGEGSNYAIPFIISIICALSLTLLVHKFPEWYVVDVVGVVMAIGAVVILGVTFAILPAVVLLIILAVYDAVSVYKTKHMISLADSVIELNLPVLLVIPKKLGYSYRKEKPRLKEQLESGEEREAMFMGLGDIVIPSLLVVSSLAFLPSSESLLGITGNMLVALGTMIGILCGFSILMRFVMKGNPQAGLPLLNSGALIGYFVTYLLIFQDFGFGFNFNF